RSRNEERVRACNPSPLCRTELRIMRDHSCSRVTGRIDFRHSQLNVLGTVAVNLASANSQTSIRQNLGVTINTNASASRKIDDYHSDVGIVSEISYQRIAIHIRGTGCQRQRIKHLKESPIGYA